MRSMLRTLIAVAILGAGCTIASASPGTAATEPPSSGWNDWTCRPSTAHPHPVVLLHGLTSNGHDNWHYIAPRLVADGYCVFSLTYGQAAPHCGGGGTGPVVDSAAM